MKIIKTQHDLVVLRQGGALLTVLLDLIDDYFLLLRDELEEEDSEFRLDGHGYIVVLEVGDNVRDLDNVGLNRENGGLLGSYPEYVELLNVGEGLQAYKFVVLYDNDYMMTFFTLAQNARPWKERSMTKASSLTSITSPPRFSMVLASTSG
ncbi:hypothetical protein GZH47_16470 [Paenibacillus rhizovicinus]|uniref:Uncharacterized protein n=1 Tax=Paenibacillus rhizovicinus TaxID=2704463 RepID=A0A6C0P1A6_9BACL|nr:hypothetical protein [Paenibacillus rhizovicinus]QHW32239.1 hypothetical protein GZH47_16470 [Paenibacillus rhizovicinus]